MLQKQLQAYFVVRKRRRRAEGGVKALCISV
jgi:hypothetical protein